MPVDVDECKEKDEIELILLRLKIIYQAFRVLAVNK